MFKRVALAIAATAVLTAPATGLLTAPAAASADVVTDWNRTMVQALENDKTPPPPATRAAAIVQSAVFDAVNGIARRYTPVHVPPLGPRGASLAASVAGAAHEALVGLFPAQQPMLDQQLASTLSQLSTAGSARAISAGLSWGTTVADQILAWRATDGFAVVPPPYTPAGVPGRWAPTGPAPAPLFRQFATMTPFAIGYPSQFLPPPPPSLSSAQYAQDFNEVKALGAVTSTIRTAQQGQTAVFWQSDTPSAIWNRVADDLFEQRDGWNQAGDDLLEQRGPSLLRETRILALMNLAMGDAAIAIWNAKNFYDTWRPFTAIQQAALDGNPGTSPDPAWTPLVATPAFQEYPAGHPGVSNAAATVLASFYGDETAFTATSANLVTVARSFTRFSTAIAQVEDARVWGGIHFRTACVTGARMGAAVARYVTRTHLLPAFGDDVRALDGGRSNKR